MAIGEQHGDNTLSNAFPLKNPNPCLGVLRDWRDTLIEISVEQSF